LGNLEARIIFTWLKTRSDAFHFMLFFTPPEKPRVLVIRKKMHNCGIICRVLGYSRPGNTGL